MERFITIMAFALFSMLLISWILGILQVIRMM